MMDQVKLGFIGVGGIAGAHLGILRDMDDVQLKALCDVSEATLGQRLEENPGAVGYADYREMLAKESLDAVYICVPPFAHGDIEETVISAGIPFFVEKPVEILMENAIRKAEAVEKSGLLTSVGYCARYLDIATQVQGLFADRLIELALGYFMGNYIPSWWMDRSKSGGQLVEQTTHMVDLVRYLVGDVQAVAGAFTTRTVPVEGYDIDNASCVTLYFENGAIGNIISACMLKQGHKTGLDLFARDFTVEFTYGGFRVRQPEATEEVKAGVNMYFEEDRAFVDALKSGDRSGIRSPYADGVKSLEISLAASDSFAQKKIIELSFGK